MTQVEKVEVPNVVGMSLQEAAPALREAGFGVVGSFTFSEEEVGTVIIGTNPRAGEVRYPGTPVHIIVSLGPTGD